jgi:hypothetical protein
LDVRRVVCNVMRLTVMRLHAPACPSKRPARPAGCRRIAGREQAARKHAASKREQKSTKQTLKCRQRAAGRHRRYLAASGIEERNACSKDCRCFLAAKAPLSSIASQNKLAAFTGAAGVVLGRAF